MSTFKTKVEDIIGITVTDTVALDDYLTASAREVTDILPDAVLTRNGILAETADPDVDISNMRIISVSRNGISTLEVPYGMSNQVVDTGSIHLATDISPVHYFRGYKLTVLPAPTSSEKLEYLTFSYPTVGNGDTGVTTFPDNAEYAVVLGASCLALINLISVEREKTFDITQLEEFLELQEDSELAQLQLGRIQHELGEYQARIQVLNTQHQQCQAKYQGELQRLSGVQG